MKNFIGHYPLHWLSNQSGIDDLAHLINKAPTPSLIKKAAMNKV